MAWREPDWDVADTVMLRETFILVFVLGVFVWSAFSYPESGLS